MYPKDVGRITGLSERSGRRLLQKIKKITGKQAHQYVTIFDFCNFTGLPPESIQKFMAD
jgi:hypothetical protein